MVKRTGPTNTTLKALIREIKKNKAPFWQRIAKELEKPARQRRTVNVFHLDKNAKGKEILVVPGTVLGDGTFTKANTVAAWRFSAQAKEKIKNTKSITQLLKDNPKAKGVRIIG